MYKIKHIFVENFGYMYNLEYYKDDTGGCYFGSIIVDNDKILCRDKYGNLERIVNKKYVIFYDCYEDGVE